MFPRRGVIDLPSRQINDFQQKVNRKNCFSGQTWEGADLGHQHGNISGAGLELTKLLNLGRELDLKVGLKESRVCPYQIV